MWIPPDSKTAVWALLLFGLHTVVAQRQDLKLVVRGRENPSPFQHFWSSTGFCPPLPHQSAEVFDLSPDMVQNLAYIAAVPHAGIQQVRIHWLLDLVKVERFVSGEPQYNFTALDAMMDLLHVNELRPGFELMGSPSGVFTDMENKTQVYWFRDLVKLTAQRYISMYGLDYVKTWNFETWNEPDCQDFDEFKMNTQGFTNYYDACSEGLKAASPDLLFGGPGDGCGVFENNSMSRLTHGSAYAEAMFQHVVNGTNFFTREKGVRIDFISLHKKGDGKSKKILDDELSSMSIIRSRYPPLAKVPFFNDEADPLVGWSKDEVWRATSSYAAVAIKVIGQHQNLLIAPGKAPMKYSLLSNDNGFLSYYPHQFTQRTLLARFQMNLTDSSTAACSDGSNGTRGSHVDGVGDGGDSGGCSAGAGKNYVTFVRKPIYAAMVLLSKLGQVQLPADSSSGKPVPKDAYAGVVATEHFRDTSNSHDSQEWAAVVYSSSDTSMPTRYGTLNFEWSILYANSPGTDLMLAMYVINDTVTNPYLLWRDACRKPAFPSLQQFEIIRKMEGPFRSSLTAVSSDSKGKVNIPSVDVQEPTVLLLHLCLWPVLPPEQVTGLRMVNITGGQVLIHWSDTNITTKCIKTFEVEHYQAGGYERINADDSIVNLFVHAADSESQVEGYYRVRAVDYWGRPGPYSVAVKYLQ